jgi:membrane protease subunit (stomatin/prohibitin family)
VLLAVVVVSLLIAAGTGFLWWRGRAQAATAQAEDAATCAKCGTPRAASDRFCSNCGARFK